MKLSASVYNLNTEQVTLVISFEIKLTNLKVYTKLKKFSQQISSKPCENIIIVHIRMNIFLPLGKDISYFSFKFSFC